MGASWDGKKIQVAQPLGHIRGSRMGAVARIEEAAGRQRKGRYRTNM